MKKTDTKDYLSLSRELWDKVQTEYDEFEKWLLTQSKEVILERSYEKVVKYDLALMCEESMVLKTFSCEQLEFLLRQSNPLSYLYNEWLGTDYGWNDVLEEFARNMPVPKKQEECDAYFE